MLKKVLIVDDSQSSRLMLREILRENYEVLEAAGGREALEILGRLHRTIAAVLLDIGMPEMDGYEVLKRIRSHEDMQHLPIIIITASTEVDAETHSLSLGATDFITKPFNADIIRRRLQNAVDLYETSNLFQSVMTSSSSSISAVTIQNGAVRFVFANDKYYSLLGYTKEQFEAEVNNAFDVLHPEDKDRIGTIVEDIIACGGEGFYDYRCFRRDGSLIHVRCNASMVRIAGREENALLSVITDTTDQKKVEQELRISEEMFRLAAEIGGQEIVRYDIKTNTYYHRDQALLAMGFPSAVENAPQTFVDADKVAPECVEEYLEFYQKIRRGESPCSVDMAFRTPAGQYRWFRNEATVIFDGEGQAAQAIIVSSDITEQWEKEAALLKLRHSLQQRPQESYTLFRWNLVKDMTLYPPEGSLIKLGMEALQRPFNRNTQEYAREYVYSQDWEAYLALVNTDALLEGFRRGQRTFVLEYRELLPQLRVCWRRLTIELLEYQHSNDVEAYLTYEDIDEEKRAALETKAQAETDPLTGVLNRTVFAQKLNQLIQEDKTGRHTLLMMDIDGFKQLNDALGHAAGDQALIDIASSLRSVMRQGDLLGRLGGDEFVICLQDVPYDAVIDKKARQICSLVRRIYSPEVRISASVGIAVYPDDGQDFDSLYRNADAALYGVKDRGKDNYAYFSEHNEKDLTGPDGACPAEAATLINPVAKRRMLIVDDSGVNRALLANIFADEFLIDQAADGYEALLCIRRHGAGLSVILLDLVMPEMDGFGLLEKMQGSVEMRTIPVIVVSGQDERETSLNAIRAGATDYVTKPVDADLIRLRVQSAISKSENERLRAQNGYLMLQSREEARYRTVLESTGTVVIEYDWLNDVFTYDPSIAGHIAGKYDNRKLWRIFLSDLVSDAQDVERMQGLIHAMENEINYRSDSMTVKLKTPAGQKQWFRMNAYKQTDSSQLSEKMLLTFTNINDEVLADEKLHFQAERDALTGLYNRRTFLQKAEELVRSRPANSFLMSVGDIDNFKWINDKFGHGEGDKMLQYVAAKLLADVRRVDGLCGRLGNDAFAALVPNTPEAISWTLEYPKNLLRQYPLKLETTFSIGYYIIDSPQLSADGMLDRASMAKQTVKGNYETKVAQYDEEMRQRLLTEQNIAAGMENALRDGMFDIYLQPQFNHITGEVCGAESLVRWLHPDKGILYFPGEFIPLFEKNGFITKLDDYVWNRTAELLRKWMDTGSKVVPVSVNVSRLDTHDPHLCKRLMDILEKNRIPIDFFRLEITESLFEESTERLFTVINRLHQAGFQIEMDDFGSGYSSLNVLKDVPVDIIKLDMRFFADTENKDRSSAILQAIMRMARWLDIPVIAEGVETVTQADFLTSIGCPLVQGYLYAPPMSVPRFEKLLEEKVVSSRDPLAREEKLPSGARDFWAVNTADSKLFYNYMDAAVVYEYHNGSFEVLRVNLQFLDIMQRFTSSSGSTLQVPDILEEDLPLFLAAIQEAIASGKRKTAEVRCRFPDLPHTIRFRCTLRTLQGNMESAVILCTVEEIPETILA